MKKMLFVLILFLMFPLVAFAANENIEIKSITLVEKSDNTKEVANASTDGEKLSFNLMFFEEGDSATYKAVVENKSNERLYVNGSSYDSNNDNIGYEFSYTGNKDYIDPGEEGEFNVKVIYDNAIQKTEFGSGGIYRTSTNAPLVLANKIVSVPNTLKNVGFLGIILIGFVLVCVGIGVYQVIENKKVNELTIIVLLFGIFAIPNIVNALLSTEIPIESTITIKKVKENPCTYDGELTQGATYVNGQYTYKYKQKIDRSSTETWINVSGDGWGMALTDIDSTDPVTSKMCTSINGKPIMYMSSIFQNAKATKYDFSSFDTSNVVDMYDFMANAAPNASEIELKDIEYLDLSNVNGLYYTFYQFGENATTAVNLDLRLWDVSSLTETVSVFAQFGKSAQADVNVNVSGWDLRGISLFLNIFQYIGMYSTGNVTLDASNIILDPTKATNLSSVFSTFGTGATSVTLDVTGWDTSGVTNMSAMFVNFAQNSTSSRIIGLDTWDMRNVTNVANMICNTYNLDFGTINLYATNLTAFFAGSVNPNGVVNMYANPSTYNAFLSGVSHNVDGKSITINYTSAVTSIDALIATKTGTANIIKGNLIEG